MLYGINARDKETPEKAKAGKLAGSILSALCRLGYERARIYAGRQGRPSLHPARIWSLVDFHLSEIDSGRAVIEIEPAEYHYNRFGIVQGGLRCSILDAALGCAVHSLLPASSGFSSVELGGRGRFHSSLFPVPFSRQKPRGRGYLASVAHRFAWEDPLSLLEQPSGVDRAWAELGKNQSRF